MTGASLRDRQGWTARTPGSPGPGRIVNRNPRCAFVACLTLVILSLLAAGCAGTRKAKPRPQPAPNEVLYERGKTLISERRFEKARAVLTEIGTRDVQSPELDPLVKLAFADSYFYQPSITNVIEAQSRYQQFLTFYPSSPLAGYAQFQLAMCYLKQSPQPHHDQTYTRKAIEEFEKVGKIDPGGRFVRAADQMRDRCTNKLAMHDFQVGVFYFRRKAFPAVIARFKDLLESYPRYDKPDGVYYYLGLALIRSGNEAEGRIYLEKVQRDYPSSRYASAAQQALGKAKS